MKKKYQKKYNVLFLSTTALVASCIYSHEGITRSPHIYRHAHLITGQDTVPDATPNQTEAAILAQNLQVTANQAMQAASASPPDERRERVAPIETITVTGSHIRGVDTSVGSQLITIGREEIERQNYGTIRDVFEDLPQNFGGGATGELQSNVESANNRGMGTTINLRGLGGAATLTLVNGRRLPSTGYNPLFSDISGIPLSAVERIEILPDGASALYGADAIGGVVNLILKTRYTGLQTNARYGAATSTAFDEYQFGQSGGIAWGSGDLFLSYEFTRSDRFRMVDRPFTASSDLRRYGGGDHRSNASSPGNVIDPATLETVFAIPPYPDGSNLTVDMLLGPDQQNLTDFNHFLDIFPAQRRHNLYSHISQDFGSNLEIFLEGQYSHRRFDSRTGPASRILSVTPDNPYYINVYGDGRPVFVHYSFENELPITRLKGKTEALSGTIGAEWLYHADWVVDAYYSHSDSKTYNLNSPVISTSALSAALIRNDPLTAFNPFGDGRQNNNDLLDSLVQINNTYLQTSMHQANITTSGTLFELLSNSIKTAAGIEFREEKFDREDITDVVKHQTIIKRKVYSLFGEMFVPFISASNDISWAKRVEVSVSLRHERTKDSSELPQNVERPEISSTNPRIGLLYAPVNGLLFRASYGTSFRAPPLSTLTDQPAVTATSTPNPNAPDRRVYGLLVYGSDPDLNNETASTYNAGFELSEELIGIANIRLNYFRIVFKNQVSAPTYNLQQALTDPAYANYVVKDPTITEIQAACASAPPERTRVGSSDCVMPGIVQFIYYIRNTNLSSTKTQGFDVEISAPIETDQYGRFTWNLTATYLLDYMQSVAPGAEYVERINTSGNPLRFRGRLSLLWETPIGVIMNSDFNYTNRYTDALSSRRIGSWSTIDIGASYSFGANEIPMFIRNTQIRFSINNILNTNPPFYENYTLGVGYDPSNSDPFGRRISVSIVKNW